ncbi:MAG: hypothetical protein J6B49_00975 [Phascolarctobacterium sp.]|nr:hypothetical protein [Phascolarctobacterium sp.]
MINCFNCYRLRNNGDVYYCPFFGLQPCIRGNHYFNSNVVRPPKFKPEEPKPVVKVIKKVKPAELKVPEAHKKANGGLGYPLSFYQNPPPVFKPPLSRTANSIDYAPIHNKIFEMFRCGCSIKKIADEVGIKAPTLQNYLRRYM